MQFPLAVQGYIERYQFLIYSVVLIIIAYSTVQYFATRKVDPREPPVISSTLPYLGHILGVLQNGGKYYKIIRYVSPLFPSTIQRIRC